MQSKYRGFLFLSLFHKAIQVDLAGRYISSNILSLGNSTVIAPLEQTTKSTPPNFSTESKATNQGLPVAITILESAFLAF